MKKIDRFVNVRPLTKTLRFKLIPQGKTEENFNNAEILKEDEKRAEDYKQVKNMLDRRHRLFIEKVLSELKINDLDEYAKLYYSNCDPDKMASIEDGMRKSISKSFSTNKEYKSLFDKSVIQEYPADLATPEELRTINSFYDFTSYFVGFHEKRKNIYSGDGKSTEIAYRIINQNLPKFLDNCKVWKGIKDCLPKSDIDELNSICTDVFHIDLEWAFTVDYFNSVLTQTGIDTYNQIIGGYSADNNKKIKGLNEYINLYNQQSEKRLPLMKQLYKQVLSEVSSISFIPDKFLSDKEVINAINNFCIADKDIKTVVTELKNVFEKLSEYDLSRINVGVGKNLSDFSIVCFGFWDVIQRGLEREYDSKHKVPSSSQYEKYCDKRKKEINKAGSYSIAQIFDAVENLDAGYANADSFRNINDALVEKISAVQESYKNFNSLMINYTDTDNLSANKQKIAIIKNLLDAILNLQHLVSIFMGSGKEAQKDDIFYGELQPLFDRLSDSISLYNRVRNYMTKKPYSDEKIKLNFGNSQLLAGWDRNKEVANSSVLLRKNGKYFLAIMNVEKTEYKKAFENIPDVVPGEETYEKMVYKQIANPPADLPRIFFPKKDKYKYAPSEEVVRIYENNTYKSGPTFNLDDCHRLIDFYKSCIIEKYEGWKQFDFHFSDTSTYSNISEFYKEVHDQGYKVSFIDVPCSYVDRLVDDGKLYLFQIYNKDFSEHSKGKGIPNLHTLYFKALFDEQNLNDVRVKLNGEAEMFYRKASINIDSAIRHKANEPIANKNPDNAKKTSTFKYDLIKDKRYTQRQFSLHLPITINYKSDDVKNINNEVRELLKETEENYIIGIDRGERNLLYVSVINSDGKIQEQLSLNIIDNGNNTNPHVVDYHQLLDNREQERDKARKNWQGIENIKNLKEGYISQAVHIICELVQKYDALIAMENLNSGFKNSRIKVEKQVYQKFEKMLIEKLNYCVDKHKANDELGSVLNGYQLTNEFKSFDKMGLQNGFIFYVPAWLTSKIDPMTGFVDLLHLRYESEASSREFISKIDRISFNKENDYFEFAIDYNKFSKAGVSYRKEWTLNTAGKRIITERKQEANNQFISSEIDLTEEFKAFFDEKAIDYQKGDLKDQILDHNGAAFYKKIIGLIKLMLQMRNSQTGSDIDYLISPVQASNGKQYCSDDYESYDVIVPKDADANGAYNIARKALWIIEKIKTTDDITNVKIAISNSEWLEYAQTRCLV